MWQCEHLSKKKRNEKQMLDFREVISCSDLHDLCFKGTPWTFDNKQKGVNNVKVRLDRAVATSSWTDLYPNCNVTHLTSSRSDHCSILLDLCKEEIMNADAKPRRYEAVWESEASLMEEVKAAWENHSNPKDLGVVASNLSGVMDCLQAWEKKTIGSVNGRIGKLRKKLKKINMRNKTEEEEKNREIER
jgi:hypothetical protein